MSSSVTAATVRKEIVVEAPVDRAFVCSWSSSTRSSRTSTT